MGYMAHHAIVVTTWKNELIQEAHNRAVSLCMNTSSICQITTNGYYSFFIPTDGSKEGWPESDKGDARRAEFKKWCSEQAYEDGSSALEWVEISYSSDDQTFTYLIG